MAVQAHNAPARAPGQPDARGHYGRFGGQYVPETLMPALEELTAAFEESANDPEFEREFHAYLRDYVGRPTNLYFAERLTRHYGGPKIYLKREDLAHTGAHKINNTIGQILLARRMGKQRIIAETGAGQHGVATATACALFGLECVIYMGEEDTERQKLNVFRMKLMGARVVPVTSGSRTLKDAMNEAIRDWVTNVRETHYIIGSVAGPHPYPKLVRTYQSVIGRETREQILRLENRLPDYLVACVGGGSNAMGLFHPFYNDGDVKFVGVEAGGHGVGTGLHSATLTAGEIGVLHGSKTYLLQTPEGQIAEVHSVSAGLDYPGVGPEHCFYKDSGRAEYVSVTDEEALEAFKRLSKLEGIIPALETAHAVAHLETLARRAGKDEIVVINLSGRGDKDVESAAKHLKGELG